MISHLQNGRYGDARILDEDTARVMHETQFSNDPRLDGMAYGFSEQNLNGERTIQHGGTSNSSTPCSPCCPSTTSGSS